MSLIPYTIIYKDVRCTYVVRDEPVAKYVNIRDMVFRSRHEHDRDWCSDYIFKFKLCNGDQKLMKIWLQIPITIYNSKQPDEYFSNQLIPLFDDIDDNLNNYERGLPHKDDFTMVVWKS